MRCCKKGKINIKRKKKPFFVCMPYFICCSFGKLFLVNTRELFTNLFRIHFKRKKLCLFFVLLHTEIFLCLVYVCTPRQLTKLEMLSEIFDLDSEFSVGPSLSTILNQRERTILKLFRLQRKNYSTRFFFLSWKFLHTTATSYVYDMHKINLFTIITLACVWIYLWWSYETLFFHFFCI